MMVGTCGPAVRTMVIDMAQTDAANDARREQGDLTRGRILAELARRESEREPSPSWQELGDAVGVADKVARYHCVRLRAAGLVTFRNGQSRTLMLTTASRTET